MPTLALLLALSAATALAAVPSAQLFNAANPGMTMPYMGLGTGGYSGTFNKYNEYPECWFETTGCGDYVLRAVTEYISVGGTRIDNANSYQNQKTVGTALKISGIDRKTLFFTSKVGPGNPLGYNDTLEQFAQILADTQLGYIDLVLIHWPTQSASPASSEALCNPNDPKYNPKQCRLDTWKALVDIWKTGKIRAIGVSNYNITHLQEIEEAGLPLPAVNQCPFNIYLSSQQMALVKYCQSKKILFNGYSPVGVPDHHQFPAPLSANLLEDPVLVQIAQKYNKTPAQIAINWQGTLGIVVNPRSMNITHMQENLSAYDFTISADDLTALGNRPQDMCTTDPSWYECAPR